MTAFKTCTDMAEVRAAIDEIDQRIVALISERLHYIEEAARLKPDRAKVRDDMRVIDVLAKVRAAARANEGDPDIVSNVYRELIERSIDHEFKVFDRLRKNATGD